MERLHNITLSAPLFVPAVGIIGGVLIDAYACPPYTVYIVAFIAACAIFVWRLFRTIAWIVSVVVAALALGGLLHANSQRIVSPTNIERFVPTPVGTKRLVRLRGTVLSQPRLAEAPKDAPFARWTYRSDRTVFALGAEALNTDTGKVPVSGRVRVTVGEAILDLQQGEAVEILGWLQSFRPLQNPGSYDWASHHRRRGVVALVTCNLQENIRRLSAATPAPGLLRSVRGIATRLLVDTDVGADAPAEGLLEAMLLGRRARVTPSINEIFVRAGCAHFLAVSGVHVVIVMVLVRFTVGFFLRTPHRRTIAMMLAVLLYTLLADPRPPILRACIMAQLYCIAHLMSRSRSYLNWMSAAAILLVILNPPTVFDVGFQLSFSAVLGVAYLSPALFRAARLIIEGREYISSGADSKSTDARPTQAPRVPLHQSRTRRLAIALGWFILRGLSVSAAAWLAGAPLVAAHFERLQPWGPFNSLLVYPLVGVVMALGFGKVLTAALLPTLSALFDAGLHVFETRLLDFVGFLSRLPSASVAVTAPPAWWCAIFYAVLFLFVRRFGGRRGTFVPSDKSTGSPPEKHRRRAGYVVPALILVLIAGVAARHRPRSAGDRLVVTVLAVGAGTAVVIEMPDGTIVLYDAGTSNPYDVGRQTIVPFLRHRRISHVDTIHISHPNLDHFSGIPSILDAVNVDTVVTNEYFSELSPARSPSRRLLEILSERKQRCEVHPAAVSSWNCGGVLFECLWPPADQAGTLSCNDSSTVLRLSYGGCRVLLTGDIEERALRELAGHGNIKADVVVLPHHGAVRPSLSAFLASADPEILIRSSQQRTADTVNGLTQIAGDLPVFNTADLGAVEISVRPRGCRVSAPLVGTMVSLPSETQR